MEPTSAAAVYILRLRSGRLYVGATTNLTQRLADHASGIACRTTAVDPPRSLAYEERNATFSGALLREVQIKRWTSAKKEALVAHDADPPASTNPRHSHGPIRKNRGKALRPRTPPG